jgi:hypothetical protein
MVNDENKRALMMTARSTRGRDCGLHNRHARHGTNASHGTDQGRREGVVGATTVAPLVRLITLRNSMCTRVEIMVTTVENMPLSGWLLCLHRENRWKRWREMVQKFLISRFGLHEALELWHSITRSSRSTCRRDGEPQGDSDREGGGASQEEQNPTGVQRSSVRSSQRQMT